jgi:hypothetical protein
VIELHKNQLIISFPEVHPKASGTVSFQRTLRVPDNDRIYPLPAGLGRFQLAHIDNYAEKFPPVCSKKAVYSCQYIIQRPCGLTSAVIIL